MVGKTEDAYLKEGIEKYVKRLKHYTRLETVELAELKNTKALTPGQQKAKEAESILKRILPADHVVLLVRMDWSYLPNNSPLILPREI